MMVERSTTVVVEVLVMVGALVIRMVEQQMMVAMGLVLLVFVGVLVLAAIALVKYIRSDSGK